MKTCRLTTFLAVAAMVLAGSCDNTGVDPENFTSTFPLRTDNWWHYQKTEYRIPFNDPAYAETTSLEMARRVIGIDTLPGPIIATIVDDTTYYTPEINYGYEWRAIRRWYTLGDNKLMYHGYQQFLEGEPPGTQWLDSAVTILDLPLTAGKTWSYSDDFGTTFYEVIGKQQIACAGQNLKCDIIEINFPYGDRPREVEHREWYSNEGLIRTRGESWPHPLYDSTNVLVDSLRSISETVLTEIDLGPLPCGD